MRFRTQQPEDLLARQIIGLAMKVHRTMGSGYNETVYRNSLVIELRKADLPFQLHPKISVMYEGEEVGVFQADIIVDNRLIVELKVASGISDEYCAQLVNYLTAARIEEGLIINFGAPSLQFRTKSRTYRPDPNGPDLHA